MYRSPPNAASTLGPSPLGAPAAVLPARRSRDACRGNWLHPPTTQPSSLRLSSPPILTPLSSPLPSPNVHTRRQANLAQTLGGSSPPFFFFFFASAHTSSSSSFSFSLVFVHALEFLPRRLNRIVCVSFPASFWGAPIALAGHL